MHLFLAGCAHFQIYNTIHSLYPDTQTSSSIPISSIREYMEQSLNDVPFIWPQ